MKKIIKHGKKKYINAQDYKIECGNCGCIFTFSIGDIAWKEKSINGNSAVRCPDCNKEIIFKSNEHLICDE